MNVGIRPIAFLSLLGLLATPVTSATSEPLSGHYAVTELSRIGDEVVVTLTLRLVNESDRDVSHARVAVERPDADERAADDTDRMLGVIEGVTVHAGSHARVAQRFVIQFAEYVAWTEGRGPRLRLTLDDENGLPVETTLTLVRAADIPLDWPAF